MPPRDRSAATVPSALRGAKVLQSQEREQEAAGVEGLLAQMQAGLERGRVPLRIYNDPQIHRLELERVFARCWAFVAHESEIPQPGDYVVRHIGEDSWIVARDDAGQVHVLFNSCRHRGTQVCQADRGHAAQLLCPYHGWTYGPDGSLVGVPNRQQAYTHFDPAEWGLLKAPQVAAYQGLIFACLDAATPPLDAYLGDFRWYLDLHLGLWPAGMTVVGEPLRWRLEGNWKSAAENFAGDSYHTQFLHRSLQALGLLPLAPPSGLGARASAQLHITECGGHASSMRRAANGAAGYWGYSTEALALARPEALSPSQQELARTTVNSVGNIFPNLSFIHAAPAPEPAEPPVGFLTLHQWQPLGPGAMEGWTWVLVPRGVSAAYQARAYRAMVANFGPAGNFGQDDAVVWSSIARTAGSVFARKAGAQLNYEMGLPRCSNERPIADWPGPGSVYATGLEEGVQRTFLRYWLREMLRS